MGAVVEKSRLFAVRIVKLSKYLREEKREFILSRQILKSGTSIGANLAEAEYAISRSDFLNKTYIALKESSETIYWLDLLFETEYITPAQYKSMLSDATELKRLLSSITKTMRESSN